MYGTKIREITYAYAIAKKIPLPLSVEDSFNAVAMWVEDTVSGLAPYVGSNGNWYVYDKDTQEFKDTGVHAKGDKGDKGEAGADGQGFNFMGAWVSGGDHHPYDVVTYQGSSYICILETASSTTPPPQDTTHWAIFTQKGADGANGTDGEDGLPALEYGNSIAYASTPTTASVTLPQADFNRDPVPNDSFLAMASATDSGNVYMCVFTVDSLSGTDAICHATNWRRIDVDAPSLNIHLYQHNLSITGNTNNGSFFIKCTIYSSYSGRISSISQLFSVIYIDIGGTTVNLNKVSGYVTINQNYGTIDNVDLTISGDIQITYWRIDTDFTGKVGSAQGSVTSVIDLVYEVRM